jgi:hypothetical protein
MQKLLTKLILWIACVFILALAAVMAAADGTGHWLSGWIAYAIVGGVGAASIFAVWHFTGRDLSMGKIALVAALLRLAVGVALMLLLPVAGYASNESNQSGYYYYDAAVRDSQAWQLAKSSTPLWKAFSGKYSGDQYGGMLALSAGVYRVLSPDAHRPWLILLLTAAAGGWGALCLGKAARSMFGEPTARLAAWIFALYPEGILLGGTHMREAFVIPAIAMTCLSLTETRLGQKAWLGWLALAAGLLFIFQPPAAVVALVVLAGAWFLDPERKPSWKRVLLYAVILLIGILLVFSVWASLPSLKTSSPLTIFFHWLQNNYKYQTHVLERSSGWIQKIFRLVGPTWQWLIVLVYGTAQPVLPAVVGGLKTPWILRIVGFFRAVGWYALVPLLLYGLLAAWRTPAKARTAGEARPAFVAVRGAVGLGADCGVECRRRRMGQSPLPHDPAGLAGADRCLGVGLGPPAPRPVAEALAGCGGFLHPLVHRVVPGALLASFPAQAGPVANGAAEPGGCGSDPGLGLDPRRAKPGGETGDEVSLLS